MNTSQNTPLLRLRKDLVPTESGQIPVGVYGSFADRRIELQVLPSGINLYITRPATEHEIATLPKGPQSTRMDYVNNQQQHCTHLGLSANGLLLFQRLLEYVQVDMNQIEPFTVGALTPPIPVIPTSATHDQY